MADVRSKNLYELLGNDPEFDPNRPPAPPTQTVDKTAPRHGKRDAPKEPPVSQPRADSSRRGGRATGGNEAAFRDRNVGRSNNREKPVDETGAPTRNRGDRRRNDRQSRTGQTDTRKQVNQGWGNQSGEKTLDDEKAGEDIAQKEENEPQTPGEEAEPADKAKSFADYLAEKAQHEDLSAKAVRTANEGVKADKKWAAAKELKRAEDEDAYIKGKEVQGKREKQRKEKNFLDVDMRFVEAPRGGGTGPRGGGTAPRGGGTAPRGGRGGRGRGEGRGEGRGGARGGRGSGGPRAAAGGAPVPVDEKNFPSLGGK